LPAKKLEDQLSHAYHVWFAMKAQLAWYNAQDIVRVLERDPRCHTLIECRLFRATNWQHFHQDEIDRLDAAAERLFRELLES
jgi:hypothetical protein